MIKTKPTEDQIKAIKFLVNTPYSIVGSKPGTGKTLIMLCAMEIYKRRKIADTFFFFGNRSSVDTKSTQKTIIKQIEEHTDFTYVDIEELYETYKLTGNIDTYKNYTIVLIPYSVVGKLKEFIVKLTKGSIAFFDEIHNLKNPKSQLTMNNSYVTRECSKRHGASATIIKNNIMDAYGVISFIDPSKYKNEYEFKDLYCVLKDQPVYIRGEKRKIKIISGYKNLDKFQKVLDTIVISFSQSIKPEFLPIKYEMSPDEEREYLEAGRGESINSETLRQFANRLPELQKAVDGSRSYAKGSYRKSSKYTEYLKELQKCVSNEESFIVYADYYDTYEMLYENLKEDIVYPIFRLNGKQKEDINKFPCCILATAAASETFNLQYCNKLFCFSIPFSIGTFSQLVGRINRMDSEHRGNLYVYIPTNDKNIDLYKYELIETNASLIIKTLGDDSNLPPAYQVKSKQALQKLKRSLLWSKQKLQV